MVDLEEKTIEGLPQRCANCGVELTEAELQRIAEAGTGPALCDTCAAEQADLAPASDADPDEEGL